MTLALLVALKRRGVRVAAAKSGPDYIDPAFHRRALGAPSVNLDSWAMAPAYIDELALRALESADLLVVESAMGLFDGVAGAPGRTGASADLAARLGLPVLLVLDVSGQSQSAAAVAQGFARHRPGVRVGGVVLNKVASQRHRDGVVSAMGDAGMPVLGALPRDPAVALPERHLGLVQAVEQVDVDRRLDHLGDLAERSLDLDAIAAMSAMGAPHDVAASPGAAALAPPGQRVALAWDAAFSFMYEHLLDGWRHAGAEIAMFSPLADESPPSDCDACWLPGGYPELHAPRLSASRRFLEGLKVFAETRPVHGECGGYMVLGQGLVTAAGERCAMAGLLSHSTSFARRKLHLGYRSATLLQDGCLGRRGETLRGHEFHYSSLVDAGDDLPLADLADASGASLGAVGARRGQVSGAYFHIIARDEASPSA